MLGSFLQHLCMVDFPSQFKSSDHGNSLPPNSSCSTLGQLWLGRTLHSELQSVPLASLPITRHVLPSGVFPWHSLGYVKTALLVPMPFLLQAKGFPSNKSSTSDMVSGSLSNRPAVTMPPANVPWPPGDSELGHSPSPPKSSHLTESALFLFVFI